MVFTKSFESAGKIITVTKIANDVILSILEFEDSKPKSIVFTLTTKEIEKINKIIKEFEEQE